MLAASGSNVFVLSVLLRAEESLTELQEAGFNLLLSPIEFNNLEVLGLVLKSLMEHGKMNDFEVHELVRYAARYSGVEPLSLLLLEFMEYSEEAEILEWALEALEADNHAAFALAFSSLLPGYLLHHPEFFEQLVFEALSQQSYCCFGWLFSNTTNYATVDLNRLQSDLNPTYLAQIVADIIEGSYHAAMEALIRVFCVNASTLRLTVNNGVSDVIFLAGVVYESCLPQYEEEALKILELLLDEGGCSVDGWWRESNPTSPNRQEIITTTISEAARQGSVRLNDFLKTRLLAAQQAGTSCLRVA